MPIFNICLADAVKARPDHVLGFRPDGRHGFGYNHGHDVLV